jgi:hypothetical protein
LSSFSTSLSNSSSSSSFDERLKPDFLLVDIFLGGLPSSLSTSSSSSSFKKRLPPIFFLEVLVVGFLAGFFLGGDRENAELSSSLYSWRLLLLLLVLDAGLLVEDVFLDPGTEEAELSSSLS